MIPDACTPPLDSSTPTESKPLTVAILLAQSRAAHLRKKHHAGRADKKGTVISPPDYPQAEQAIREAIRYREEAHTLDPDHTDPVWVSDQALNRGVSHEALLAFFRQYLTIP